MQSKDTKILKNKDIIVFLEIQELERVLLINLLAGISLKQISRAHLLLVKRLVVVNGVRGCSVTKHPQYLEVDGLGILSTFQGLRIQMEH